MRIRVPVIPAALATLLVATSFGAPAEPTSPQAAFERLESLAGIWQGQAGHDQAAQPATARWRVASGGTVVQETLFPDTPHEMISMYHLASGSLVLTHYCSMGNQPRMRLDPAASSAERLVFVFDGGTNLDPARDVHVHSGTLNLEADRLRSDWVVWKDGREAGHNVFDLRRSR